MSGKHMILAAGLGLLTGSGLGLWVTSGTIPARGTRSARAMWAESYGTYAEMAPAANAVVLATSTGSSLGRSVDDGQGDVLKFGEAGFVVDTALSGSLAPGTAFTVEFTWGSGDAPLLIDGDGGPYEAGRQYLLVLREQEGGTGLYIVPNPQGRFAVDDNGVLQAVNPSVPVATELHGLTVTQAMEYHASVMGNG